MAAEAHRKLQSLIGRDTVVRGGIEFDGALLVEGRVVGPVRSADGLLVLAQSGVIEGEVAVGVARIEGRVDGDVQAAQEAWIGPNGRVVGAVRGPRVWTAPGAQILGPVRTDQAALAPAPPASP